MSMIDTALSSCYAGSLVAMRAAINTSTKAMNVSLTPKLERFTRSLVKEGRYNSASEVVRTGLRLLEEQEAINKLKIKELKRLIQEGFDSGPAVVMSNDELKAMIRDHAATLRQEVKEGKRPAPTTK